MDNITVISVIEHDKGTLDLMIKSVFQCTNPRPHMILGINGGKTHEYSTISHNYLSPDIDIVPCMPTLFGGSNRHGETLNELFSRVTTKYTAIIESDAVVLDGWNNLSAGKKMLAAKKGPGLYHVCFLLFETAVMKGMDFRPGTDKNRGNRNYSAQEDVGWRIKDFINEEQIDLIDFVDCKTSTAKITKGFQSDEFHKNDKVICMHFGRGSNLAGKAIRTGFDPHAVQLSKWKEIVSNTLGQGRK